MSRKSKPRPRDARQGIDVGDGWILYPLEEEESDAPAPPCEQAPEEAVASLPPPVPQSEEPNIAREDFSDEYSSRFPDPVEFFANKPTFRVRVYAPEDLERRQPLRINEALAEAKAAARKAMRSKKIQPVKPVNKTAAAVPPATLPPPARENARVSVQAEKNPPEINAPKQIPASLPALSAVSRTLQNQPFARDEHDLLAHLLTYVPLQAEVHSLADRLLKTYGSLRNVLDVLPEQLAQIPELGVEGAQLIALLRPLLGCYLKPASPQSIHTKKQIVRQCMLLLSGYRTEVVYAIALSCNLELMGQRIIALGGLGEVQTSPRQVAEVAINCNAPYIILCHNHPGGRCDPSDADLQATRQMQKLLSGMDITLLDHVIVAPDGHYSLLQHGLLTAPPQLLHSYLDNTEDLEQL